MPLWVLLSVMAAAAQTARTAGQKHLAGSMSSWSATWVRFLFGLPFVVGYLVVATESRVEAIPAVHVTFLLWCAATAAALPPLLPPGTQERFHGLWVAPKAEFSVDEPMANSSRLSRPQTKAPASFSFVVAVAS